MSWQAPSEHPDERWQWYEDLWAEVCLLRERYRLPIRTEWWKDAIQVEALAALAAWVDNYDSGVWDDPPGKLALLYDLERIGLLLRSGQDPFYPERRPGGVRAVAAITRPTHPRHAVVDDRGNRSGGHDGAIKTPQARWATAPGRRSSGASARQARAAALQHR